MRVSALAIFLLIVVFALTAMAQITTSRVFVSSATYQGDLGGLAGADAKCQTLANSASLGGTWMAWLSDSTQNALTRLQHANGPYKRVDGITIANSWNDLTDGSLLAGIDRDEHNLTLSNAEVWTGTGTSGIGSGGCADWTSNSSGASFPVVGLSGQTNSQWTNIYLQFCDRPQHLYCVQVPVPEPAINGTVTYPNAAVPPKLISNVVISGTGSPNVSTTTLFPGAGAGTYSLIGFGTGAYTVTPTKPTGGVNGINSFDAGKIAAHVAGVPPLLSTTQKIAADVSNNGSVNSFDAALLAKYVTSPGNCTVPTCGISGTWRFFTPGATFPVGTSPTSRTYGSVSSEISDQDYWGILVGEVSGNWNPATAPVRPFHGFDQTALSWLITGPDTF